MKRRNPAIVLFPLAIVMALVAARPASAQAYKVEKVTLAAPAELSAPVRDILSGDAYRVTGPNGVLCEVWVRKSAPVNAAPSTDSSVAFGQLTEGVLIAAVRFPAEVVDYRSQHIKAGAYTLRYGLNPVDGNHMGVAPQRDFLLATPAAVDADPATVTHDQMVDLSRKTTGTKHPSVWSIAPPATAGAMPSMLHQDDPEAWMLNFPLALDGGKSLAVSLVVWGHAPES